MPINWQMFRGEHLIKTRQPLFALFFLFLTDKQASLCHFLLFWRDCHCNEALNTKECKMWTFYAFGRIFDERAQQKGDILYVVGWRSVDTCVVSKTLNRTSIKAMLKVEGWIYLDVFYFQVECWSRKSWSLMVPGEPIYATGKSGISTSYSCFTDGSFRRFKTTWEEIHVQCRTRSLQKQRTSTSSLIPPCTYCQDPLPMFAFFSSRCATTNMLLLNKRTSAEFSLQVSLHFETETA